MFSCALFDIFKIDANHKHDLFPLRNDERS